jgi:flagellar protein FliO/FliZ
MYRWSALLLLFSQTLLAAEPVSKGLGVKTTAPLGAESLLQTAGGLLLILFLIIGGAWLFKRYGNLPMAGKGLVKVLSSTSVGTRERVVLVEVENTRLLLGVAPGQVRTLYELPSTGEAFQQALDTARVAQEGAAADKGAST